MMARRSDGLVLLSLVALAGLAVSHRSFAQSRPQVPVFPSEVELITVDAVVLDGQGRPVAGLTRDDFRVTEEGQPLEIASFEAFALEPAPEVPTRASGVASNAIGEQGTGRAFAILLDDLRIAPERSEDARRVVRSLLDGVTRQRDEVVFGTTSGNAWWTARTSQEREDLRAVLARTEGRNPLRASDDRMTEYEAFRISNFEDAPAFQGGTPEGPTLTVAGQAAAAAAEPLPTAALGGFRERVKRRWEELGLCVSTSCDGMVRARAGEIDNVRRGRTRATLEGVRQALDALSPVRGRKSLLLVSEGFLDDPHDTGQRAVAAASREANAAIYFVDVRGLAVESGFGSAADAGPAPDPYDRSAVTFEASTLASAGAVGLADDTGGFSIRNTNDFSAGAARIGEESRVFYLLGFPAPQGKPPGRWRKLQVTVTHPGLRVRARRGYALSAPTQSFEPDKGVHPAVAHALDSPHSAPGIPLRAMAYVFEPRRQGGARVFVAVEFDAARLAFRPVGRARRARIDVSLMARLRDDPRGFRHDDTLELTLYEGETAGWRSHAREFLLPSGVAQVRVVTRDASSGALGSVSSRVEVPAADTLRVSTPILTDALIEAGGASERPQLAITAHRVFPPGHPLYCQFEVFGAALSPAGESRVTAGLSVWTPGGRLVRQAPASPIAADPSGRVVRLVGIGVQGLDEGSYDLVLDVEDQLGGSRLKHRESFTLASDTAAP